MVCRVHFLRNVLAQVPKGSAEMVAAAVRTIFAQPKAEMRPARRDRRDARPAVTEGRDDAPRRRRGPARVHRLPAGHWKKIWSTNPLERLDKEVKRRTDVVRVSPNPEALLRLAGAVLVEAQSLPRSELHHSAGRDLQGAATVYTDNKRTNSTGGGRPGRPTAGQSR